MLRLLASFVFVCLATNIQAQALFSGGTGRGNAVLNFSVLGNGDNSFLNYFKTCDSLSAGTYAYPAILNSDGFPTSAPTTDIACLIHGLPSTYSGDWIIDFLGTVGSGGTAGIRLDRGSPGYTIISDPGSCVVGSAAFNLALTGINCTVRFACTTSSCAAITFRFLTTGVFSNITRLRLYRADQATNVANDEIFNPDFLSVVRSANPRVLRFLDWASINFSQLSRYAYQPSSTAFTFGSVSWPTGAWAGTVGGTDTYTVGNSPDSNPSAYVSGETIQVQFTNANTSTTPTLNRNAIGAKTIVTRDASALSVGGITSSSLATLVYDDVLDKFIWVPRGELAHVPISYQVALCNVLAKDCWIQIPAFFDDASITSYVAYVRDNLNPSLKLYLEYSNEIWNFAFSQTDWIQARGAALGFAADNDRRIYGPYGLRVAQIANLATTAWTTTRVRSNLKVVIAFQAFGSTSVNNTYRFQGTDLGSYGFNAAPNRPIDLSDVGSYANYVSGSEFGNGDSAYTSRLTIAGRNAADDYATGTPSLITSALNFWDNDLRNAGTNSQTMAGLNTNVYPAWQTIFAGYNKNIVLYEGGYEGTYPTASVCTGLGISAAYCGSSGTIANLINGGKNNDRFRQSMNDLFRQFMSNANSLMPSWFKLGPDSDQWAMFPIDIYSTPYKSYNAFQNFNAAP